MPNVPKPRFDRFSEQELFRFSRQSQHDEGQALVLWLKAAYSEVLTPTAFGSSNRDAVTLY